MDLKKNIPQSSAPLIDHYGSDKNTFSERESNKGEKKGREFANAFSSKAEGKETKGKERIEREREKREREGERGKEMMEERGGDRRMK